MNQSFQMKRHLTKQEQILVLTEMAEASLSLGIPCKIRSGEFSKSPLSQA